MINKKNHIAWSQFMYELEDAKEHLENLIKEVESEEEYGEEELKIDLGHIYAHLNRAWNSRNSVEGTTKENWEAMSEFPKNVEPIG